MAELSLLLKIKKEEVKIMKYILFCFAIFMFASCKSSYNNENNLSYEKNEKTFSNETYIVKTMKGFDTSKFASIGAFYDGTVPATYLSLDGEYYTVRRDTNIEEKEFIKSIEALYGVCYACLNAKIDVPKVKKHDAFAIRTLGLDAGNLDEDPEARGYEYALRITQARNFYDEDGNEQKGAYKEVGYGDNKVVIAIIDTGLNMRHPDFTRDGSSICLYAKSIYEDHIDGLTGDFKELNTFRQVPIGSNEDAVGHGTHCSGTMCAVEGNNEGIAGVAYKNTFIISYKGFKINGGSIKGLFGSLADLADIVSILKKKPSDRTDSEKLRIPSTVPNDFQITQKTVPVNMSLGGTACDAYQTEMMNYALSQDILPVVAMGNDGRLMAAYPRSIYGCIPVGATDYNDKRTPFSEGGECISVSAPGFCIISTYNGNWTDRLDVETGTDKKGTQFMSGTSMATPFVTGLLGYLLSFDEGQKLNSQQFKKLLEDTADKIDFGNAPFGTYENGHSLYYGFGRVNVLKAAKAIAKKNGAVEIPKVDSFYLSIPLIVTTPEGEACVRLYEVLSDGTLFPLGLSYSSKNNSTPARQVKFYGLRKGCKYRLTYQDPHSRLEREYIFVANGGSEMNYSF